MPIYYKIDVIEELRQRGFNQRTIRTNALIPSTAVNSFRNDDPVSFDTLAKVCALLDKQPGDIIGYLPIKDFVEHRNRKADQEKNEHAAREIRLRAAVAELKNKP